MIFPNQKKRLNFEKLLTQLEENVRLGKIAFVKTQILQMTSSEIPRPLRFQYAELARRVRLDKWGLRLLKPIVRSRKEKEEKPTAKEIIVYSGLLIKFGAFDEALELLNSLDELADSQIGHHKSQVAIAQWDYRSAKSILMRTLRLDIKNDYQMAILKVNLSSCLIFLEKYKKSKTLLLKLLKDCEQFNWSLLAGNCYELLAQNMIFSSDWTLADDYLAKAKEHSVQHQRYSLFVIKWQLIIKIRQIDEGSKIPHDLSIEIEKFKELCRLQKSWEILRDIDFHVGIKTRNFEKILFLYFGTPHKSYRLRIKRYFESSGVKLPLHYRWTAGVYDSKKKLNLRLGLENQVLMKSQLKVGSLNHRLLLNLTQDFYKPVGLGHLFSALFPGEYFDPDHAIEKINQALKIFRKWTRSNDLPFVIQVQDHSYKLHFASPFTIEMDRSDISNISQKGFKSIGPGGNLILQIKLKWPYQNFTTKKAAEYLQLSTSKIRSVLKVAVSKNLIFSSGSGRSLEFRFKR